MSLLAATPIQLPLIPRKRSPLHQTSPRPTKVPRLTPPMGSSTLRRTESYISFTDIRPASTPPPPPRKGSTDQPSLLPYHRTLQYYKDQRDRRKALFNRTVEPITIRIITTTATPRPSVRHHQPPQIQSQPLPSSPSSSSSSPSTASSSTSRHHPALPAAPTVYTPPRHTSPLAPTRLSRPGRPVFPRSKPEPDLYRKAIKTCMQASPEGQKILRMGPRLALSIMSATKELERIVAAQNERDDIQDVVMLDATSPVSPLTKSWVIVPGEDWEMIDCAA